MSTTWLKCALWGTRFPPTLCQWCGRGRSLHYWINGLTVIQSCSLLPPPRMSATHIADKSITKEKNNQEFFIYGPQCGGWGLGGGYDWAHLASQLSSHLSQYTCKIWNQSNKDILCYLENDEMSADERWLNHSSPNVHLYSGYNKWVL